MSNVDLGPRKTMFVLVVVVGCFSVLWPKVFYPMLMGSANQQMKPSPIDKTTGVRQERPAHLRPEMLHPALRERGRAIPPTTHTSTRTVVEGRPGPIPGMRPTIGGPGHIVPPSTKGTSTMSIVMPIYTIGIVVFFTYTLVKLLFKKQSDSTTLYPPVEPEPKFRKQVFEQPPKCVKPVKAPAPTPQPQQILSNGDTIKSGPKLGWKERDTRDIELDQLRQRLRETELAMERIVAQMANVPLRSQEGRSIFLEGKLPAQSQLLVTDAATEVITADSVTSGKMTLSLIPTAIATDEDENALKDETNGDAAGSSTDEEMEHQDIEEVSDILT